MEEDEKRQREVLVLALAASPARLTSSDLQARMGDPAAVERAVEMLAADDLIAREGDEIVLSPAAIRFGELGPRDR